MRKSTSIIGMVRGLSVMSILLALFTLALTFTACSDDDDEEEDDTELLADDTDSDSDSSEDDGSTGENSNSDGSSSSDTYKGHAYVDLGLSVKWATCNVGASSPEDYGNYYVWGEIATKDDYSSSTSATYGVEMDAISGNGKYDVAAANWGGTWRMPTDDEMIELRDNCTWIWTTQNDVNGYLVTGSNGNSIFLPAAGFRVGTSLYYAGSRGYYWSSSPISSFTDFACILIFDSSSHGNSYNLRDYGHTVRPVTE